MQNACYRAKCFISEFPTKVTDFTEKMNKCHVGGRTSGSCENVEQTHLLIFRLVLEF